MNRTQNSEVANTVVSRCGTLVVLLLIQSASQMILQRNEGLIHRQVIIPMFLTMLVGAGGNAGNQSAVRVITGLATHQFGPRHMWRILLKELIVGLCCAVVLSIIALFRVRMFFVSHMDESSATASIAAIVISLFAIVVTSVVLGAALPFVFQRVGLRVEHSAPAIQVLMDIIGVWTTCTVASWVIE